MTRHAREKFFVVGEGMLEFDQNKEPTVRKPSATEAEHEFRFSRLGPKGPRTPEELRVAVAAAMTDKTANDLDGTVPAGFTYLGQFIDHDLTMDGTATALGSNETVGDLLQGRSPEADLDSLYGRGPFDPEHRSFYEGVKLKLGTTKAIPGTGDVFNTDLAGFDLPRAGVGEQPADRRKPLIPDQRNDENLPVACIHRAFINFHNKVVDRFAGGGLRGEVLFEAARDLVVRHYQWLVRTDFLPRLIDPAIVQDVFENGRKYIDPAGPDGSEPDAPPTMPIEFSIAAYRLGHSMVRGAYQWNRPFNSNGKNGIATLLQLFTFTGVSGNFTPNSTVEQLDDPAAGGFEQLPSNWVLDFRRMFDFTEAGRPDLVPPDGQLNHAKRIDSLLVDPLTQLPAGTFAGRGTTIAAETRNLAFRNLTRASMVELASGQQLAKYLGVKPLTREQLVKGDQGASLAGLNADQQDVIATDCPLWLYILREAELNDGRLGAVGGRIVAELFHRALLTSRTSTVRDSGWRPSLGPDENTFRMVDLLLFAFDGQLDLLNPLGD